MSGYHGEKNTDNMYEGYGKLVDENTEYLGQFLNGKYHGLGVLNFKNKEDKYTYKGEFKDGKMSGLGIMELNSQARQNPERGFKMYYGEFDNNKPHGLGHMERDVVDDFYELIGEFQYGKANGLGQMNAMDRSTGNYIGEIQNNQKHGIGKHEHFGNFASSVFNKYFSSNDESTVDCGTFKNNIFTKASDCSSTVNKATQIANEATQIVDKAKDAAKEANDAAKKAEAAAKEGEDEENKSNENKNATSKSDKDPAWDSLKQFGIPAAAVAVGAAGLYYLSSKRNKKRSKKRSKKRGSKQSSKRGSKQSSKRGSKQSSKRRSAQSSKRGSKQSEDSE
jgi:hypothetical protein